MRLVRRWSVVCLCGLLAGRAGAQTLFSPTIAPPHSQRPGPGGPRPAARRRRAAAGRRPALHRRPDAEPGQRRCLWTTRTRLVADADNGQLTADRPCDRMTLQEGTSSPATEADIDPDRRTVLFSGNFVHHLAPGRQDGTGRAVMERWTLNGSAAARSPGDGGTDDHPAAGPAAGDHRAAVHLRWDHHGAGRASSRRVAVSSPPATSRTPHYDVRGQADVSDSLENIWPPSMSPTSATGTATLHHPLPLYPPGRARLPAADADPAGGVRAGPTGFFAKVALGLCPFVRAAGTAAHQSTPITKKGLGTRL